MLGWAGRRSQLGLALAFVLVLAVVMLWREDELEEQVWEEFANEANREERSATQREHEDLVPDTVTPDMTRRPNIVVIMADDLGSMDLGFRGATRQTNLVYTPVLDSLVQDGVWLEHHRSHSVCSPARAAFLTGRKAHELGAGMMGSLGGNLTFGFDEPISKPFQDEGYRTYFFGKWHQQHAHNNHPVYDMDMAYFDHHMGFHGGMVSSYWNRESPKWLRNKVRMWDEGYATDLIADEAITLLEDHAAAHHNKPFFAWLSFNAPHAPGDAPPELEEEARQRLLRDLPGAQELLEEGERNVLPRITYAAMIHSLDINVGRVIDTLRKLGQLDNTIIAFMGDNGGIPGGKACNGHLRGSKSTAFEGGVRTPAFVYAPALIGNGTRALNRPVHIADWWRTLADAAGVGRNSQLEYLRTSTSFWEDLFTAPAGDGVERWPRDPPPAPAGELAAEAVEETAEVDGWLPGPSKGVLELNFLNTAAYLGKYKMTATLANLVDMGDSAPLSVHGKTLVGVQPPGEEPFVVDPAIVIGKAGYLYDVDVEFFNLVEDEAEANPIRFQSLLPGGEPQIWLELLCEAEDEEPLTGEEHEACVELVLEIEEAAAEWEFSGLPDHLSDPLESWYVQSYQIGRDGNRVCIPQDHHGMFLF